MVCEALAQNPTGTNVTKRGLGRRSEEQSKTSPSSHSDLSIEKVCTNWADIPLQKSLEAAHRAAWMDLRNGENMPLESPASLLSD